MNSKREGGCDRGRSLGCRTLGANEAALLPAGPALSPGSDEQAEILKSWNLSFLSL